MAEELWKTIKGYEGLYEVSDLGRVKSIERTITNSRGRKTHIKETILKPETLYDGYQRVCLSKRGKKKHHRVATLVFEAFVGPVPEGKELDHISGFKQDNQLDNLRAVSHRENCWNPITRERHIAANERRSQKLMEYWRKKKASSTKPFTSGPGR